jgi:hypothetical protein
MAAGLGRRAQGTAGGVHLTYGNPAWLDDVITRYGLNPPTR